MAFVIIKNITTLFNMYFIYSINSLTFSLSIYHINLSVVSCCYIKYETYIQCDY